MRTSMSVRSLCVTASLSFAALAVGSTSAAAQNPPAAKQTASAKARVDTKMPRTATARCTDNSWSKSASEQGACSSHGGVAKWFGKAPKGTTARCNDGEYWTSEEKRGACSDHGGVAYWTKKAKGKKVA